MHLHRNCYKWLRNAISLILATMILLTIVSCDETVREYRNGGFANDAIPQKKGLEVSGTTKLCYVSSNGSDFAYESRSFTYNGSTDYVNKLIAENLKPPETSILTTPLTAALAFELELVTLSQQHCDVYLSCKNGDISLESWLLLEGMLLNTMYSAYYVQTLSLYKNGVMPGYDGIPIGYGKYDAQSSADKYVSTRYNQIESLASMFEFERTINIPTFLYSFNASSECFYSVEHTVKAQPAPLSADDSQVRLQLASDIADSLSPVSSSLLNLVSEPLSISVKRNAQMPTEDAIVISVVDKKYSGTTKERIATCITLCMTGFLPETETVIVSFGDNRDISKKRMDCVPKIGTYIRACFPFSNESKLVVSPVPIAYSSLGDILELTKILFNAEDKPNYLFPTEIDSSYVIDVYISDGIVVLDMTKDFYIKLNEAVKDGNKTVSADDCERLIIYSIVNTLTTFEYSDSVLFLADGERVGTVGKIMLDAPLLPNPGLNP